MQLAHKMSQIVFLLVGMSLIAAGTVLALHGLTAQTVWVSLPFGIADRGVGITLFIAGLTLIAYSTRTRVRPAQSRRRFHKRLSPSKPPAKPEESPQDTASDLKALIRWDEESPESGADSLAEAHSGNRPKSRTAPRDKH